MTILMIFGIVIVIFLIIRSKRNTNRMYDGYDKRSVLGSNGSMLTGMVLGYLLSRELINHGQYEEWRSMDYNKLNQTLLQEGITTEDELVEITDKASSGQFDFQLFDDGSFEANDFDSFDDFSGGSDGWGGE